MLLLKFKNQHHELIQRLNAIKLILVFVFILTFFFLFILPSLQEILMRQTVELIPNGNRIPRVIHSFLLIDSSID